MKIIEQIEKELLRIGASEVVCWELFPGEELFQLADEQRQSDYMYTDKILDLLCDITDNAGREAMWEYLKFECVPVLPVSVNMFL